MSSVTSSDTHYSDLALAYCDDILTGKIPACKQIRQAVQRHVDDLDSIADPAFQYTYDVAKAEKVCRFGEKLPHVKGQWASRRNNRLHLEPWQCFFLTSLFGWVEKTTGYRRFRSSLLLCPRKNGKSFLMSVVCLFMLLADQEPGADIYCAANSLEQAMTVFRPCRQICESLQSLRDHFEIEISKESLLIPDGSSMKPLTGIPRDGGNPHCAVLDEYHEASNDAQFESLTTGMGARTQPLMLVASTAGSTIEGPCYRLQKECEEMLAGNEDRPELFALVFTIDPDVDWTTDTALKMANPNFGVSVIEANIKRDQRNAIRSAAKQNTFKTKHLNIWTNASTAFFNMQHWAECEDRTIKPEDFKGKTCWMAADLSSKRDLTVVVKVFKDGNTLYVFPKIYLPAARANDPSYGQYAKWVAENDLIATPGNTIDIEQILDDTVEDIDTFSPVEFAFDEWQADFYTQTLQKRRPRLILAKVPQKTRFLSPAMYEIDARLADHTIKHSGNHAATWCMANVMATPDKGGHVFPFNPDDEKKIDFATCLMTVVNRVLAGVPKRGTGHIEFA